MMVVSRPVKRSALLCGTALQAVAGLVLAVPALAQPAPLARPQGGRVVAGSASIGTTATTTTVTQSSNRAAVDWTSFDVGRDQSVRFQQPSTASVTLNRVTGGDPSAIAGQISANGQIVITNRSGVVFHEGAQVNAQSVVVSAADISNANFMAGRMVFDRAARPDARVENHGTITVQQAGLAALVAPSVANSGVINARLGQVVLAGAAAHTLDMYGDGLVSIDVTKQVRQAPVGPDGKAATVLVTNTGAIRADGGVVQLTASAADGVVQTLVRSGGTIRADTAGGRAGRIEIAGTGGSVVVEGRVAADGRAPGSLGGQVMIAGSDTTAIAAGAHVSADGHAGGGTVAVGTTLARARSAGPAVAGTAARTVIAAGARVSADATAAGNGGRVTVLSTQSTAVDGAVAARGGKRSGDGGTIELSGETGFRLTGSADTSAPHGQLGSIIIDPRDLTITSTPNGTANAGLVDGTDPNLAAAAGGTSTDAYITPAQIDALSGNVHLQTTRDLTVASSFTYGGPALTLEAGRNLTVDSGVTVSVPGTYVHSSFIPGSLQLIAGSSAITGSDPAGTLTVLGNLSSSGLSLSAGTGGITLAGQLTTSGIINAVGINTPGTLSQTGGSLTTGSLVGTAGTVSLLQAANQIGAIGNGGTVPFTTTVGGFSVATGGALTIGTDVNTNPTGIAVPIGQTISIQADTVSLLSGSSTIPALSAPGGTVALQPLTGGRGITLSANVPTGTLGLTPAELDLISSPTLQLGASGTGDIMLGQEGETIDLNRHGGFGSLVLTADGSVLQGGPLLVRSVSATASSVALTNPGNAILSTGDLHAGGEGGAVAVTTAGDLLITGAISANAIDYEVGGNLTVANGAFVNGLNVTLSAGSPNVSGHNGAAALTVAGSVISGGTVQLLAGTGGISLSGNVNAPMVDVSTAGPVTQTTGGITATDLSGTAGSVSLTSVSNAVAGVASQSNAFTVTGAAGDFTLVDRVPLTVGSPSAPGGLSVQNRRTITLATDSLTVATGEGGPYVTARNGVVVVEPLTPATPIALTASTKPATTLALTTAELAEITASDLILGAINPGTRLLNTGTITIGSGGGTVDLGQFGFGALGLNTAGAVVQAGALAVGTLSSNVGSLTLNNGSNFIGMLAGVSAKTDISLHSSNSLNVGQVIAGGNITLSSSGRAGMTIYGNVTGQTVSFDSIANSGTPTPSDPGITQTGGVITAATLTGAGGTASFTGANQVTQLGDFATYGAFTLTNARPLNVIGAVNSQAAPITLNAAGLTQATTSSLIAPELDGSSSASTLLTAPGNLIAQIGTFSQTGGDFTLATASPTLLLGGNPGAISAAAGSLTFLADRVGLRPESAAGAISAPLGTVAFAPLTPSRRIELIGTGAADPSSLSLSQAFLNTVAAGTLQLGAAATPTTPASTGPINIGNPGDAITLAGIAPTLNLVSTGAVTEGGTASLTVGTLTGSTGATSLPGGNQIGVLGPYTASDAFQLNDTAALTIAGPVASPVSITVQTNAGLQVGGNVTAPAVTLQAKGGPLTQTAGLIAAAGTLELDSSGVVSQAGTGTITAGTLTGTAGAFALTAGGNAITQLGAITTSGLQVTNSQSLAVSGPVSAGNTALRLTAGDLTVNGSLSVNDLALAVAGNVIGAPGAAVTVAGTLSGSAQTLQFGKGVGVATLGDFTTTGDLTLAASGSLAAAGTIRSGTAIALSSRGATVLSGDLSAPSIEIVAVSSVSLGPNLQLVYQPGTVTQTGGSLTSTDVLQVQAGDTLTQSAGALSGGAGSVLLSSVGTLSLGGTVSGGVVTLTAADRQAIPGFMQTALPGTIIQTGGTLTATSLGGLSSGATTLTQAGNAVATLGNYSSTGGFALTDSQSLGVTGPVTDPTGVMLTTSGALTLNGTVQTGALTLTAVGAISQPGGAVVASSLTGSGANVSLTQSGNQVGMLGTFASTGDFALTDRVAVAVSGAVSAGMGRTLTLADDALTFTAGGSLSAPGGTVALLEYTPGAGTVIGGGGGLSGTPPVTAATLVVGSPSGGPVTIAGALNLSTVPVLDLQSGGPIAETGAGAIRVGTLTGQGASASLGGPNQIGAVAGFSTASGFALTNGQALAVTGPVKDGVSVAIAASGLLTVSGAVSAPSVALSSTGAGAGINQTAGLIAGMNVVDLTAAGPVIQSAGAISAGLLTGSAQGPVSLGSTSNAVATLGSFGSAGGFALTNGQDLSVAGPLTDQTAVALSVGGALSLSGTVQTGTLTLNAANAITQPGGSIVTSALTGSGAGVSLPQRGNQVGTLGTFASTGDFTLTDGQGLSVAGAVSAGPGRTLTLVNDAPSFSTAGTLSAPGGTVALLEYTPGAGTVIGGGGGLSGAPPVTAGTLVVGSPGGGPVTIAGALNLSAVPVLDLESGGVIAETGAGAIRVGTLTGGGASAALGGANQIGTLGGFTAAGDVALTDTQPLVVSGPLSAATLGLRITGSLTLAGPVVAPGGTSLAVSQGVTETGGSLATGSLTGSAAAVSLDGAGNTVATLGAFTTGGGFSLSNAGSLVVAAPVNSQAVTLNVSGDLTLNSSVTAGAAVLNASRTLSENPGGAIAASRLDGSGQSVTLGGANLVDTLGNLAAQTTLLFANSQALSVAGTVTAGPALSIGATGPLAISGTLNASAVTLSAAGPITAGGTIQTGALSLGAGGGGFTQTGGTVAAGTLSGTVSGPISLGQAGTATVASIGNLSSGTGIAVVDSAPLQLGGTVAAPNLAIASTGLLQLNGGAIAADGPNNILQVRAGADGSAAIGQTGTTAVRPFSAATSSLTFAVPASGGTVTFANLGAPRTDIVLNLGSGSASGQVNVGNLLVLGSGGSATLTGTVRSLGSFDAAEVARISPSVNALYTLNGCAIGAASCSGENLTITTVAAALIASITRPDILVLDVLDLSVTRDRDDPELLLPNISDRDY